MKKCLPFVCVPVLRTKDLNICMCNSLFTYIATILGVPTNLSDEDFIMLLKMVCKKRGVDGSQVKEAEEYLRTMGQRQSGILTHENLKATECPKFS